MIVTAVTFGEFDEDDGFDDKDEMWIPLKKDLEKSWPLESEYYESVLEESALGPELTLAQRDELLAVCLRHSVVFPRPDAKLGQCTAGFHHIKTGDVEPVYDLPRRHSASHIGKLERQVNNWIELGVVVPCSSLWSSNIFLVPKKG
ncbi:hypothetical protein BV898_02020 [Hypsibius exemplaris]|uniref:Uncharacterized protein n=1 Tax=Hypsibius exemplaris TaxID=2072580 RepID=A0A1W0X949_HYPEX|nr:hypothetical protein BV898_02020 [Hypsibius exemplaris]